MMRTDACPDADLATSHRLAAELREGLGRVLRGKPEPVRLAVVTLLSGGHLLLDDVPGVGKTLLAKALARAAGGSFRRVQATPDLLPSELTGVSVFHLAGNEWEFRAGPLFANVVLVDELNRATPRTQSALLEAMEEHQVTVDGVTRPLPRPFFLIATQNPFETAGTFPLVEGQLDRFTLVTEIGAARRRRPSASCCSAPAASRRSTRSSRSPTRPSSPPRSARCAPSTARPRSPTTPSRSPTRRACTTTPPSARARARRSRCCTPRRRTPCWSTATYVVPDDIARLAVPVLAHRLVLRDPGRLSDQRTLVQTILDAVPAPRP